MTLQDLGYNDVLAAFRKDHDLESLEVGRVVAEHKERYIVRTPEKEFDAELIGNLKYAAQSRVDFPAVGDWVAVSEYDEDKVLIRALFPRNNKIERQAVGKHGEKQILAANVDYGFIVQAVDRDFNLNRIERYLTICYDSKVEPFVLLSKVDLIEEQELVERITQVETRLPDITLLAFSNKTQRGITRLKSFIHKGKTYCLLGSSGVGKSSLINSLSGKQTMKTDAISESTHKGRHVTTHRELVLLPGGGLLIDNPGLREVGIADAGGGLEETFSMIHELARGCKFKDCTHTTEIACAVLKALEEGNIDADAYENYLKMEREQQHFASTVAERRKKDKNFGKMVRDFKKVKKMNRD